MAELSLKEQHIQAISSKICAGGAGFALCIFAMIDFAEPMMHGKCPWIKGLQTFPGGRQRTGGCRVFRGITGSSVAVYAVKRPLVLPCGNIAASTPVLDLFPPTSNASLQEQRVPCPWLSRRFRVNGRMSAAPTAFVKSDALPGGGIIGDDFSPVAHLLLSPQGNLQEKF